MNQKQDPLRPVVSAYAAVFEQLAAALTGRTRRAPEGTVLVISGVPIASLNAIISPSLEPNVDEIAALAQAGSPWELPWSIHVRGVPGARVAEVAAGYGLTGFTQEPLMIRPPELGLPAESGVGELRVRAVRGDEYEVYARTLADGFEAPYELFRVLADPALGTVPGITCYLAEVDGVPVGTGMAAVAGDLTGIFNISTLPKYRRRGYGLAVTSELVRAGFAARATTAYLYSTKLGQAVYESLGFRTEEYLTMITASE
jgi:ribosomal protein S18 acetylase RimI-like enzyme